ncbi:MAG: NAD-dependent epimerase/dehydratase family protein [Nitrososphaerota archaeon]
MKKIVIAGSGYIGAEIAHTFSDNYEVVCIDHGKNFDIIKKKLPKTICIKGDLNDENLIKKEIRYCDIFFYCIDTGGVVDCIKYPTKYYDINVTHFKQLLKSLEHKELPYFFLFSSSFVYPDIQKITEETQPNPETVYGKLRMNQEQILKDSNLNFTILRLSNIFGYGQFFNIGNKGAIEKFIENVFEERNIMLHGDGTQLVDYLHKTDLMNLLKILCKNLPEKQVYNISSGQRRTILDIAEIIKENANNEFGLNVKIIKMDEKTKMPNLPLTLPQKIINEVPWKPSTNIELKIKEMMNLRNLQHKGEI